MKMALDAIAFAGPDQLVAVNDRCPWPFFVPDSLILKTTAIRLEGPPGWRSPCIALNAGLANATGDYFIMCAGDVVLDPQSIANLREMIDKEEAVYFGKVIESKPELCYGKGHAGPILCSSAHTRPLTFLTAAPTKALKAIGGWDEAFQKGVCYEDDDLTLRLWKYGLDFIFDDRFSGIHQTHPRAYYKDIAVADNLAIFLAKHGTTNFYYEAIAHGKL